MTTPDAKKKPIINLQLFGGLSSYRPNDPNHYLIVPGMTVLEVMEQLAIPTDRAFSIFVNDKKVTVDFQLEENQELKIFPLVGGG
jgi:sulfur carrier protein ThiS